MIHVCLCVSTFRDLLVCLNSSSLITINWWQLTRARHVCAYALLELVDAYMFTCLNIWPPTLYSQCDIELSGGVFLVFFLTKKCTKLPRLNRIGTAESLHLLALDIYRWNYVRQHVYVFFAAAKWCQTRQSGVNYKTVVCCNRSVPLSWQMEYVAFFSVFVFFLNGERISEAEQRVLLALKWRILTDLKDWWSKKVLSWHGFQMGEPIYAFSCNCFNANWSYL